MKSFRYLSALFVLIPTLSFATPLTYKQLQQRLQSYAFMESLEHSTNTGLQAALDIDDAKIKSLQMQLATDEAVLAQEKDGIACATFVNQIIQYQHNNYVCYKKVEK